jgi:hypothetical protein
VPDPEPFTIPEAFRKAVAFLDHQRVPHVLVGGLAAGLQGEPRITRDVDFLVTLKTGNIHRLAREARTEGFDIDSEQAETRWLFSGFVRLWLGPKGRQTAVDLMALNSEFLREASFRAQQSRFCGVAIPVASPEDMILFKAAAWRTKDIPDAEAILDRHRDHLDLPYLRKWAAWFQAKNLIFQEMPERLEALLAGRQLPPARPDPS